MAIVKGFAGLGKVYGVNLDAVNAVSEDSAKYEVLEVREQVLVKVAKESGFMQRFSSFEASNGEKIPAYWRNGKPLKGGVFLNLHLFGITTDNLGKSIIATVKIIKKTMSDGREYIMLDVFNTPGVAPTHELKFPEGNSDGIPILGTDQKVEFRPRAIKE